MSPRAERISGRPKGPQTSTGYVYRALLGACGSDSHATGALRSVQLPRQCSPCHSPLLVVCATEDDLTTMPRANCAAHHFVHPSSPHTLHAPRTQGPSYAGPCSTTFPTARAGEQPPLYGAGFPPPKPSARQPIPQLQSLRRGYSRAPTGCPHSVLAAVATAAERRHGVVGAAVAGG